MNISDKTLSLKAWPPGWSVIQVKVNDILIEWGHDIFHQYFNVYSSSIFSIFDNYNKNTIKLSNMPLLYYGLRIRNFFSFFKIDWDNKSTSIDLRYKELSSPALNPYLQPSGDIETHAIVPALKA